MGAVVVGPCKPAAAPRARLQSFPRCPLPLQERVAQFVVKEYGNAPSVPTAVLMEVLRQELQVRRRAGGRPRCKRFGGVAQQLAAGPAGLGLHLCCVMLAEQQLCFLQQLETAACSNVPLPSRPYPTCRSLSLPLSPQAAQGSAAAIQLPFPVPLLPTGGDSQASDAHSDDEHLMSAGEPSPGAGFRRTPSGHTISPPKGVRPAPGQLPTLFQQQQQQQQQQMQAAAAQQQQQQQAHAAAQQAAMHQQLLAQMQQQQQQPGGFMPGGFPGQFQ